MSNEIALAAQSGPSLFRASTDAAGLCREIVLHSAKAIQGRKFVQVEGWQAIAIAHGCAASSGEVPEPLQLYVQRIPRDAAFVADLESRITSFLSEVGSKVEALRRLAEGKK